MPRIKHFNGDKELAGVHEGKNGKLFGYVSKESLIFVPGEGWKGYVPVERSVEYKTNPSRHECDVRCTNATGRIMRCECSCGGKNHGRGAIVCEEAA